MTQLKEQEEAVSTSTERIITVLVNMEHVRHYGHSDTMRELAYGCDFEVKVGDEVICPPSPYWPRERIGMVSSLTSNYRGPVKYVRPVE